MSIIAYSDFLNSDDWEYVVQKTLRGSGWHFGMRSSDDPTVFKFWYMELINDKFFTDYMLNLIKEKTGCQFNLIRVYANGQTHGLSGNWHQDEEVLSNKFKTFLYYVNPTWDPVWGANTVFTDPVHGVYSQIFEPNTGLLFNSNIYHVGLEPTRHCRDLRVSIAFKLEEL